MFYRFSDDYAEASETPGAGQGLRVLYFVAQTLGGGWSKVGCKYFAYCLIKHQQTSEFGLWFMNLYCVPGSRRDGRCGD